MLNIETTSTDQCEALFKQIEELIAEYNEKCSQCEYLTNLIQNTYDRILENPENKELYKELDELIRKAILSGCTIDTYAYMYRPTKNDTRKKYSPKMK